MAQYRKERLDRPIKARCEDIFALTSMREILYLIFPRALLIVGVLIFPLLKGVVGLYWEKVLVITCVIGLLSLSWDLMAQVGLISLGQAFFFGVGAYITGILNHKFSLPPFVTIPLGTIGGGIVSTLFLLPALRARGVYFSILTLIIPLLLSRLIEATKIFGGTEGLSGLTPFQNFWIETYLPIFALLVCLFGFRRLINSDYGLIVQGVRDNDRIVMSIGINIYKIKAHILFISSLVGAFAGSFITHYYRFVGLPAFALDYSILPLACAILGGPGSFAGALVGSFILVPLSEVLRVLGSLRVVFYSLILAVCILSLPEGIFHYIQRKYHQFERIVEI
uniref:Branched-chain amino acid ABC transporter permease n=1 Tax=candidate division WOR-3 bacterium TaxID=2052148 RepID=A0A7C2K4G7_UNCW3